MGPGRITCFGTTLFFFLSIIGQLVAQPGVPTLYQRSLVAYAKAKAERDGGGQSIKVLANNALDDGNTIGMFPNKIGSFVIEYLSSSAVKDRCRKTGKEVPVVQLQPLRTDHDIVVVRCAEFSASTWHGKLTLGVYGGFEVRWRLDHSTGEYIQVEGKWYPALFI